MKKILELFESIFKTKWFGTVTLKFQNGQVRHIEKNESLNTEDFEIKEEDF
jgi:hypothetical protein